MAGGVTDRTTARARFEALVTSRGDGLRIAEGALWIAAESSPDLRVEDTLLRIDALAAEAAGRCAGARAPAERIEALAGFFRDAGFRGNREDYYDPRNSYLQEVLARRTGIPITLAILHLEVARRLGWPVQGVSFPGHFLVKHPIESPQAGAAREVVLDPFSEQVLDEPACRSLLERALGPNVPFDRRWLRAATAREILARLLGNLKQIHVAREELEQALACCDRILFLFPDAPGELRDRGIVYQRLECFGPARADLERFLALAPSDPSADAVRELLAEVTRAAGRVS